MYKVKITAIRKANYKDLQKIYENKLENPCDVNLGDTWVFDGKNKPIGLCDSAWQTMEYFARSLSEGKGNFFDGWMKNENSALISCNDGFRPVSFLLETIED